MSADTDTVSGGLVTVNCWRPSSASSSVSAASVAAAMASSSVSFSSGSVGAYADNASTSDSSPLSSAAEKSRASESSWLSSSDPDWWEEKSKAARSSCSSCWDMGSIFLKLGSGGSRRNLASVRRLRVTERVGGSVIGTVIEPGAGREELQQRVQRALQILLGAGQKTSVQLAADAAGQRHQSAERRVEDAGGVVGVRVCAAGVAFARDDLYPA